MIIALLGEPYLKGYRGLYRKFPCAPKENKALSLWTECLCLTQGFPIEYNSESFAKLYDLFLLLRSEKIQVDLIIADRNVDITGVKTKLLGYDITNNTMFYSILGEKSLFQKTVCKKWGTNEFKLLSNVDTADVIAEHMNEHIDDFEKEGKYRRISVECVEGKTGD